MGFTLDDTEEDALVKRRRDYGRWLETATEKTCGLGVKYFARDARYQGPFFDVTGRDEVVRVFMKRFAALGNYRLKLRDAHPSEDGRTLYLRWDAAGVRKGVNIVISGASEVMFDMEGKVASHIDYYDPLRAFFFTLPLIGGWFRRFYKFS